MAQSNYTYSGTNFLIPTFYNMYVYLRPCLPGLYRKYTKQYLLIPRAKPEGLMNIAECIHRLKPASRHGLMCLYPGNVIVVPRQFCGNRDVCPQTACVF